MPQGAPLRFLAPSRLQSRVTGILSPFSAPPPAGA